MNNAQWSKCPKCKQDEKYVVHEMKNGEHVEVRVCSKQCMIDKRVKK